MDENNTNTTSFGQNSSNLEGFGQTQPTQEAAPAQAAAPAQNATPAQETPAPTQETPAPTQETPAPAQTAAPIQNTQQTGSTNYNFGTVNNGATTQAQFSGASAQNNNVYSGTVVGAQSTSFNTNPGQIPYDNDAPTPKGFGIASLVLGIFGLLLCCCGGGTLFGIVGIILGCVQQPTPEGNKPGIAIAGIVISAIAVILSIGMLAFFMATGSGLTDALASV